jgi:hypothetical protein
MCQRRFHGSSDIPDQGNGVDFRFSILDFGLGGKTRFRLFLLFPSSAWEHTSAKLLLRVTSAVIEGREAESL